MLLDRIENYADSLKKWDHYPIASSLYSGPARILSGGVQIVAGAAFAGFAAIYGWQNDLSDWWGDTKANIREIGHGGSNIIRGIVASCPFAGNLTLYLYDTSSFGVIGLKKEINVPTSPLKVIQNVSESAKTSEFHDKVVVITGGNSGIGAAVAEKFNLLGAKIVIFDRADHNKLEQQRQKFKQAIFVQGDVRNLSDIDRLYRETEKNFGKIDVLIASAGIIGNQVVDKVDEEFFDTIVNTNFKGVYFTVQRAVPNLNKGACVVLLSSAACHAGFRNDSVYSATKAAVSILARNFSADLIERGIRVNAISPGYTDTAIFDKMKMFLPQRFKALAKNVPVRRFAEATEIAEAVLFLSSVKSSYVVGIDLVIDGGGTALYPH